MAFTAGETKTTPAQVTQLHPTQGRWQQWSLRWARSGEYPNPARRNTAQPVELTPSSVEDRPFRDATKHAAAIAPRKSKIRAGQVSPIEYGARQVHSCQSRARQISGVQFCSPEIGTLQSTILEPAQHSQLFYGTRCRLRRAGFDRSG